MPPYRAALAAWRLTAILCVSTHAPPTLASPNHRQPTHDNHLTRIHVHRHLPQELRQFGLTETGVLNFEYVAADGSVDPRWKDFMRFQIKRARQCFAAAEEGVGDLHKSARWPVWSALILYRMILDRIEENGYDNFTKRAYVPKWQKLACLPAAFAKANL